MFKSLLLILCFCQTNSQFQSMNQTRLKIRIDHRMVIILIMRNPSVDPTNYPNGKTLTKFNIHVHPQEFMYSVLKTTMFYIKTNIQSKLKLICVVFSEVFWDALLMTSNRTRPSFLSSWVPWVCRRPCSLCYLTLPWTSSLPFLPHSIPFRVSPTGQPVSHTGDWVHAIPSRNLGIRQ